MISTKKMVVLDPQEERVPLTFTRYSVAYDLNGVSVPVNQPRFQHKVPDVTVTNLLTGNQSDGGDTSNPELLTLNQRTGTDTLGDTTGFTAILGDETISSSTTQAHSGTKSCKVVTDGSHAGEGVYTANTTVANATAYLGGAWVFAPLDQTMSISLYTNEEHTTTDFTGTGAWQWVESSATSGTTTCQIRVKTRGDAAAVTFYVDDLRLAKNDTTGFGQSGGGTVTITATGEKSNQGYRSFKVVNDGGAASQGIVTTNYTPIASTTYTYSARVFAPLSEPMVLTVSGGGATTSSTNFTGTGNWQSVNIIYTTVNTNAMVFYVRRSGTAAVTFYLDSVMLETGSTAHNWAYGGSSYSSYKTEYGCLVEEAHTNLLSANQSTGTDSGGDTTGFAVVAGGETLSTTTEQAIQGTKSLKIVTNAALTTQGCTTTKVAVTASNTHTAGAWVYAPLGSPLRLALQERTAADAHVGVTTTDFTGTGNWQFVSISRSFGGTGEGAKIAVYTATAQTITFYVDMLQLTATAYPLSWTLGESTQAAESLTANSPALGLGTGTIELEAYINSVIKTNGVQQYLINSSDGDGNNQTILLDDTSNNLTISTKASSGATTVSYADSNFTLNTWLDIASTFNATNLKLFTAGTTRGTPSESPNLPATQQTVYLGSKYDGTLQANTLIRNVTISKPKRSDTDITARAGRPTGKGFGVDRQVTFIAPLMHDLKAWKVRS
jgi:hypothetical protein